MDDKCGVCGGALDAEGTSYTVSADVTMSTDECSFEPNEIDSYRCANDGWLKIEHEEFSDEVVVHGSCYFDHDDILSVV